MNPVIHLERLRRHFEAARRSYDIVTLLDLSHSLRIWADLKDSLPKSYPKFHSTSAFKTGIPARKVLKAARGHESVFSYMPGGTVTYASNGSLASGPGTEDGRSFTIGVSVRTQTDSVELKNFSIIFTSFEQPLIKALGAEQVKRCNFMRWMGAEAVRANLMSDDGNLKLITLSREKVIRRVANTMDGSHPSDPSEEIPLGEFDAAIRRLMEFQVGGLPLPYFILLKCAQDIVEIAPKLLDLNAESAGET
ncbi:hypothetical protein HHSLTHF2_14460 [Vreelandella venusta]|uniref:Uncharacterized protein n=1 Tax=Halomonas hydrothermalis TaxID=115561 RepID=A0A6F8U344_9GAMM|nr:hypothetical protein [Halomonas hydrothermalis]BCB07556.1 hypothetical protein HHSLTHF2_14460 [Halomonas hydrothermalis]